MNRDFKGVWIPKEVWLDERLTQFQKLLLAEIDSLDNDEGCYASNEYFAKFFDFSERYVIEGIQKLKELKYVYEAKFDGRKRILKSKISPQTRTTVQGRPELQFTPDLPQKPLQDKPEVSKIGLDNKVYNKDDKVGTEVPPLLGELNTEEEIRTVAIDEDGYETQRKKAVGRNMEAVAIARWYTDKLNKEYKKGYINDCYPQVVKAIKMAGSAKIVKEILEEWFNLGKSEQDTVNIRKALDAYNINKYKANL